MPPVQWEVIQVANNLHGQNPRESNRLTSMFGQALGHFKNDIINYAKLQNPNPIGTLRQSPLTDPNPSIGINMRRISQPQPVWENRGTDLNSERRLEQGTEDRNSPILDQVKDTVFRREILSLSDLMNNESNISRPPSRMSDSEPTNNGSNNNISKNNESNNNNNGSNNNGPVRARGMSLADIMNNEPNNNNGSDNNRPSSRISNSDPSNNGSTNNTRSFLGFSFGVDYSNYTESFTNCIVNLFDHFMNDPIFYIIISFCAIVVLPFALFYIECFNKIKRFRVFLLIKAIIFNVRKMITSRKREDFKVSFRFSAFPWILAEDYNDFISKISNIFKGDFNWTSISVNPCFKW